MARKGGDTASVRCGLCGGRGVFIDLCWVFPQWFAREILHRRLSAQSAVVGYDFRYGKARGGTVETLQNSLPELDVIQVSAS